MQRLLCFALTLLVVVGVCAAQVPTANHVFVIVEENHSYSSVIGNGSMPYLNELASKYGLAAEYYANTHPSIGNYFMMTTGEIVTNDDHFTSTISVDNIVRHLLKAGKSWKAYAEDIPEVGYTGRNTGHYVKRHNPLAYFSDVANSSDQRRNLVPFTQLAIDLRNNAVPSLAFIVPNLINDAHDGSLAQADAWLSANVPKILASSAFTDNGLLVIVFDESYDSDKAYGGGHIPTVIIGPKVKSGYKSTVHYAHENLLKTVLMALRADTSLGAAAGATSMSDFFAATSVTSGVNIHWPSAAEEYASPVHVAANATASSGRTVTEMRVYLDYSSVYKVRSSSLDTYVKAARGVHNLTINAWDTAGAVYKSSVTFRVQ